MSIAVRVVSICAGMALGPAIAAEFFVDPVAGSRSGDGSAAAPWQTLQQVVEDGLIETRHWDDLPYSSESNLVTINAGAPVKAGDTIWLSDGFHGEFSVSGAYNEATITVAALPGHEPQLAKILVQSGQYWVFRGLSVSSSHGGSTPNGGTLVSVESHGFHGPASDVELANSDVFTVDDAAAWGPDEWINRASNGLNAREAQRVTFRNNRLRNVRHGITVGGGSDGALVIGNTVTGFSADGMRGLADDSRFEYNVIRDAYVGSGDGDSNHDDGFQSWSTGTGGVGTGEVRNVVLRGNIFINYSDPDQPYRATLQGIGCFDGFFVDWVVENNVVVVDHWHGITFMGMRDSRIVNNTVIDPNDSRPGPSWVRVADHKDGSPSENVVVRNNLTPSLSGGGATVVFENNLEYSDAGAHFVAPPYQLRLLSTSTAIDAGTAVGAPDTDRDGTPRQGPPDIGAYEHCPACVLFANGFEGKSAP